MTARPILVTRPGPAGQALTAALNERGADARWLPAFDIGPAPDEPAARAALAGLARHDLAIFVSPNAVRAAAALLDGPWPAATAIGAVGGGTARAVRSYLPAEGARLIAPDGDDGDADAASGSEAFWQALTSTAQGRTFSDVLLLRAAHGREWLPQKLAAAGARVTAIAVYTRSAHAWSTADRAWLRAREGVAAPVVVVTSSEAVDALLAQAGAARHGWLRSGVALASHPRIAQRLREAGFGDVREAAAEVDAILAAAGAGAASQ